jgi:hypothetical protein
MTCRVLEAVNKLRAEYQIGPPLSELPKGKPGSVCRCPMAIALDGVVDGATVYFPRIDEVHDLPTVIRQFTELFDDGDFPELEL